jgi:hypothetical protein
MVKHHATLLLIGGISGFIGFSVAPGALRPLTFFIPLVILCTVFVNSASRFKFNFKLFFFLSFLIILLPSNFFTLDTVNPYVASDLQVGVYGWLGLIGSFVLIALPMAMAGAAIYAIIWQGKIQEGFSTLITVITGIVVAAIAIWILGLFNMLPQTGVFAGVQGVFDFLTGIIGGIGVFFGWVFSLFSPDVEVDPRDVTAVDPIAWNNTVLDAMATGPQPYTFVMTVSIMAPLILSLICFFLLIHAIRAKDYQKVIDLHLVKAADEAIEEKKFVFRRDINVGMILIIAVIITIGLGMYISFGEPGYDPAIYGLYFAIDVLCLVFLSQNLVPYRQTNTLNFIYGCVFGFLGIYVFFQLFQPEPLDVLLSMEGTNVSNNFLIQWILVAPTESLLFHIFLPGLFLLYLLLKYRRNISVIEDANIYKRDLRELRGTLYIKAIREDDDKKKNKILKEIEEIDVYMNQRNEIDLNKFIYTDVRYVMFFIASLLLPNIIFALYHNFHSGRDFLQFWSSGAGLVYLGAGLWLSAIAWYFDWRSAIVAHALSNTFMLLMIGAFF